MLLLLAGSVPLQLPGYAEETSSASSREGWFKASSDSVRSNELRITALLATVTRELKEFLTDVTIFAPQMSDGAYSVVADTAYTVCLTFAEKTTRHFSKSDVTDLFYPVPAGFSAQDGQYDYLEVEINGELIHIRAEDVFPGESVSLYRVSGGMLEVTWSPALADYLAEKGYTYGDEISVYITGPFVSGTSQIRFSDRITRSIVFEGGTEEVHLNKTMEEADLAGKEVTWKIFFSVPAAGLPNAVLTDTFPTNGTYVEPLKPLSASTGRLLLVTGLLEGEEYEITVGQTAAVVSFYYCNEAGERVAGLKQNSEARNITVLLKTVISEEWIRSDIKTDRDLWHQNYAELQYRSGEKKNAMAETILTDVGRLRIRKRISAEVFGKMTEEQKSGIVFTVTGEKGYTEAFTLADMGEALSYLLIDLPVDVYTVAETGADNSANVPSGYKYKSTSYNVEGGKVAVTVNRTSTVTVANVYAVDKGSKDKDDSAKKAKSGGSGGASTVIQVSGTVVWDDQDNAAGRRPQEVLIDLYAGEKYVGTKVATAEGNWEWSFANLVRKDADTGENIRYSVRVQPVSKYDVVVNGYRITCIDNPFKAEETLIRVQKIWDDDSNAMGMRPESIRVMLSNGSSVLLSEKNGWMATVSNLPMYDKGKVIAYSWTEELIPGYRLTDTLVNGPMTILTNSCIVNPRQQLSGLKGQGGIVYPDFKPELPGAGITDREDLMVQFPVEVTVRQTGDTID